LIAREDMVVTVSHSGYVKRVPLTTYRAQRRGGKGRSGMATRDEDFVARLFVANTHTPVLFFSSMGQVYKLKVWRLPVGEPQARGKALINILPLDPGERITTIMPLPEDEGDWQKLDIMFSTLSGNIRRNSLADFIDINRNGKIAMKLDEGDSLVDVATCSANDDVLLTTKLGQAIRFQVDEVRVFKGRASDGVRGISLAEGDKVISMAIIHHFEADSAERSAFLKMSRAVRGEGEAEEGGAEDAEDAVPAGELSQERYAAMSAAEQFILTVSENGYGKRTSSHEYRITGRGGKGIVAMAVNKRNGPLIGSFPVDDADQIMLVTDGGQVIRVPVDAGPDNRIRIVGRSSQGVTIFNTAEGEKVVSVERIVEPESDAEENGGGGEEETPAPEA
ncbi:MAG TPA: DNA gyrase C-terminal beta-propeller domain-containing protein, partial [Devosia sp.]